MSDRDLRRLVRAHGHLLSRFSRRTLGRAAAGAAAAAALSGTNTGFTRGAGAQGASPSGGITISLAAEPSTLEWWNAFSIDGHPVLRNTNEALLNRDPVTNELVGELATAWEWLDQRTIRFTLRQGVTFHNGEALNAEVAAFGVNYTWSPDNAFDIAQFMGSADYRERGRRIYPRRPDRRARPDPAGHALLRHPAEHAANPGGSRIVGR